MLIIGITIILFVIILSIRATGFYDVSYFIDISGLFLIVVINLGVVISVKGFKDFFISIIAIVMKKPVNTLQYDRYQNLFALLFKTTIASGFLTSLISIFSMLSHLSSPEDEMLGTITCLMPSFYALIIAFFIILPIKYNLANKIVKGQ